MKLDTNTLAGFGAAALIPGMQHMLDVMQAVISEHRALLAQLQASGGITIEAPKRRGRPRKNPLDALAQQAGITAREVKLLAAVTEPAKKRGRPKAEPDESEAKSQSAKISRFQKSYWAKMTPEQKRAEVARRMGANTAWNRKKGKKAAKKAAAKKGHPNGPVRIGDDYTLEGAARELGVTVWVLRDRMEKLALKPAKAKHQTKAGMRPFVVLSEPQVKAIRQTLNGAEVRV